MKLLRKFKRSKIRKNTELSAAEKAERYYGAGDNCAQAVLQATCPDATADLVEMADVFGGGIDDSKCLCGAVTGAVMSLSLQGKGKRASELVADFKEEFRTTCCKGLTARYEWLSREHLENCRRITGQTAALVEALLQGKSK